VVSSIRAFAFGISGLFPRIHWDSFRLPGESLFFAWPKKSNQKKGHPAARPCGFAALLGLTGGGRTRLCEPQTCCRPSSRQPCATRPRRRGYWSVHTSSPVAGTCSAGRPSSNSAMTLHGGSLVERELDLPVCVVLITEKRVECARPQFPFTRVSSAGLAGRRAAACLRLAEPSSAAPRQAEQRSEPVGPRSRVPRGIAKGGWASSPPWLAGVGETGTLSRRR